MRTLSHTDWVTAALETLAEGGIGAIRVEPLAERLEVTKGSFYHHFASRRALEQAVLAAWEHYGTTAVIGDIDASASSPVERLRHLAFRTMQSDPKYDAIENAIRAWAAIDTEAAATIGRVDRRRLDYVAGLLRAIGLTPVQARRRARLFYRMLIGEFVWRSSGGPAATRADIDDAVGLMLSTPSPAPTLG